MYMYIDTLRDVRLGVRVRTVEVFDDWRAVPSGNTGPECPTECTWSWSPEAKVSAQIVSPTLRSIRCAQNNGGRDGLLQLKSCLRKQIRPYYDTRLLYCKSVRMYTSITERIKTALPSITRR